MTIATWLVDVGYVVKASEGKFKLDYIQAHKLLVERFGSASALLFNGLDPAYGIPQGLQRFYWAMEQYGMEVRLQPMQSGLPGTNHQRRVDVDLSAHLVWRASLPETRALVLTTGDQDFVPAVDVVRQRYGKQVILFTYDQSVHVELSKSADEWWLFENEMARLVRL